MAKSSVANDVKSVSGAASLPRRVARETSWYVSSDAPTKPEDLPFVGRDEKGISWWSVTLPKTDYWDAHQVLGRAYALGLLDLLNNPNAKFPEHILSYIVDAQMRWNGPDPCGGAIVHGFHEVLSEYLATGTARR
jgi:hypothetical protein